MKIIQNMPYQIMRKNHLFASQIWALNQEDQKQAQVFALDTNIYGRIFKNHLLKYKKKMTFPNRERKEDMKRTCMNLLSLIGNPEEKKIEKY